MTFDELWRMNLAGEKKQGDLTAAGGTQMTEEVAPKKMELTEEDRAFLLQIGVSLEF
jgi:hypothetical protein